MKNYFSIHFQCCDWKTFSQLTVNFNIFSVATVAEPDVNI